MEKDQFISIIDEHQRIIYKTCHSYCCDAEKRKDLQQEILIRLWHTLDKFDGRAQLSTWIYQVALNTAISFYRSDARHTINQIPINSEIISLPDQTEEETYEGEIRLLYQFIEQQSALDKALLLLYLDQVRYHDIASILGISESNVVTKINRLKKKIKKYVEHIKKTAL